MYDHIAGSADLALSFRNLYNHARSFQQAMAHILLAFCQTCLRPPGLTELSVGCSWPMKHSILGWAVSCMSVATLGSAEWLADISLREVFQRGPAAFHAFQDLLNVVMQLFSRRRDCNYSVWMMTASLKTFALKAHFHPSNVKYGDSICPVHVVGGISFLSCLLSRQKQRGEENTRKFS